MLSRRQSSFSSQHLSNTHHNMAQNAIMEIEMIAAETSIRQASRPSSGANGADGNTLYYSPSGGVHVS